MPKSRPAETSVVTAFVTKGDRVLLLKRSALVGSYRGQWAGVSGYLETDEPIEQAWVELREELGAGKIDTTLEAVGEPFSVKDEAKNRAWCVHPFRFSLAEDFEPKLDWEHIELKWILPTEMKDMDTVPGLWKAWCRVAK